jgi:hypothetical protein
MADRERSDGWPEPSRTIPPWRGWGPLFVLPAAVIGLWPREWPRWVWMWVLAFAVYVGCKWLTWRRTPAPDVSWRRHAGYLLAWPGLDAPAFLSAKRLPDQARPTAREWGFAAFNILVGSAVFWGARRLVPAERVLLLGWAGIMGFGLILNFGIFRLLSCGWRAAGVEARPLMINPVISESVSELWGKRWNTAFRDLAHRFVYRPVNAALGPRWAIAVGFGFSGLVHDLVISVPAGGGYGGPTLYFAVQGVALLAERSRPGRALGLGRGVRGWLFTVLVVIGPSYILFHPPFVRTIVVPFMRALGAA